MLLVEGLICTPVEQKENSEMGKPHIHAQLIFDKDKKKKFSEEGGTS